MLYLASANSYKYELLENPSEIDYFSLRGLGYFKKHLGMSDYPKYFKSYLKRQGPLLLVCLSENSLVGWCMNERWDRSDKDKTPIYVLRAIEVHPAHRGRKIGSSLIRLMASIVPGHIVTKPLSEDSQAFFEKLGFIQAETGVIDFRGIYGYMVLPSIARKRFIEHIDETKIQIDETSIKKCNDDLKVHILRDEVAKTAGFAQAFVQQLSKDSKQPQPESKGTKTFIKRQITKISCECGSQDIDFYSFQNGEESSISAECDRCHKIWFTLPT